MAPNMRSQAIAQKGLARVSRLPVFVAVVLGLGISLGLFFVMRNWDQSRFQVTFEREAGLALSVVKQEIENSFDVLRALSAFYQSSEEITREEFGAFVGGFLKDHEGMIQAIEWIPLVRENQRDALEKAAQAQGFQFTEKDPHGKLVRASRRPEHYPVYFVEPHQGNEATLGYDLASGILRRQTLILARDTGSLTASPPLALVQETGKKRGFAVFLPIFHKGAVADSPASRRANLAGFYSVVFRVEDFFHHILESHPYPGVCLYVYDHSLPKDQNLLFWGSFSEKDAPAPERRQEAQVIASPRLSETYNMGGQEWSLVLAPTRSFSASSRTWVPWITLAVGVLITSLASVYIAQIQRGAEAARQNMEDQSAAREALEQEMALRALTEQTLLESERRYRTLFESATDAIFIMEAQGPDIGRIVEANLATAQMHGYTVDEICALNVRDLNAPESIEGVPNRIERLLRGEPLREEAMHRRKDGTVFPIEINARSIELEGRNYILVMDRDITEQKRIEADLKASELRYRLVVENSTDVIWTMDPNSPRFTFVSQAVEHAFGYSPKEFLGMPWYDWVVPQWRESTLECMKQLVSGRRLKVLYEAQVYHKNGDMLWCEIVASVSQAGKDGELQIIGISRDVTDRKESQRKLQESEANLRSFFDAIPESLYLLKRDGTIVACNRSFADRYNTSVSSLIGKSVFDVFPQELVKIRREYIDQVVRTERPRELESQRFGRVIHSHAYPVFNDEGVLDRIAMYGVDITEFKKAQEEIQETNAELRSINRIISAITGFVDLKAVLEQVLDEVLELIQLEGGEIFLMGRDDTLKLGANRAMSEAAVEDLSVSRVRMGEFLCGKLAQSLEPLVFWTREEILAHATRQSIREDHIHFHAAFPLVTGAKCVGVLCVFTRSERKPSERRLKLLQTVTGQIALAIENARLYEESRSHAAELERIVAERTRDLVVAKDRAETADRIKSAFLATMSHELRTPLNSIIGFTGIILQGLAGPLNTEQTKQLEMVRSSSRHLLALINDVLDISKIEAGQLQVSNEQFDLKASIGRVVATVAPLADRKGLALRTDIALDVNQAVGDQRRVEQILLNLLNNAIKFTDNGKVTLQAKLVPDFEPPGATSAGPAIRMSVTDTGIGIKPDDLKTLFQPFRQIESGLSRNYDGTGLGLAICRRLADLMGGDINAESTWTKGSTFTFTLPLKGSDQSWAQEFS